MQPGAVVAGRFELERVAGAGGMGTVYRAFDRKEKTVVALKVLMHASETDASRFLREASTLASLRHPAIVRYVAHGGTPSGAYFLVMEWLEGETLSDRLRRRGLDVGESLTLVRTVADALGVAHGHGILHRDIKPQNLWLVGGDLARVKLLDFGIARPMTPDRTLTQTGAVLGTPGYMAPEQVRGTRQIDARADVFALGCLLFRCLAGRAPFTGDSVVAVLAKTVLDEAPRLSEVRPDTPPAIDRLVARLLAKEPEARPADAREVATLLGELDDVTGKSGRPAEPSTIESITEAEQRLLSVIMAGPVGRVSPGVEMEVRRIVDDLDGRLEWLADGTLMVPLLGAGAATDLAARAARGALALREHLGGEAAMVVATGRALVAGRLPVGAVIERAAELLERGSPGRILVDEVTSSLLDDRFVVSSGARGAFLQAARDALAEGRTLLGRPSRFVGRDREMAVLEGVLAQCVEESVARAVIVTAPAGTGKSRLRHEFLRRVRAREDGVEVLTARADPLRAGAPFAMLAEVVRRAAGVKEGEPAAEAAEQIGERVRRHVARDDAARVARFLCALVGLPPAEIEAMEPIARGDAMRAAWLDFLAAESRAHPVLLVLEDLHWGDKPTVEFVDQALRALHDRPLMVLALARPEVQRGFAGLWASRDPQELRLGPLTPRASDRLVRDALGDRADEATVQRVLERAGGNAFFLEELVRAIAEGRTGTLPESVLGMVQARLEALPPEARRVLRAASVYGTTFWRGGVIALLGADPGAARVEPWLAELCAREVVAPQPSSLEGEQAYVFRHDLVQETAYQMLPEEDRALGHRLAARWLERVGFGDAALVGEHYARGGEPERALEWFGRAAALALQGNDFAGAIARAERALELGPRGETRAALLVTAAEAHGWMGDYLGVELKARAAMQAVSSGQALWYRAGDELLMARLRGRRMAEAAQLLKELRQAKADPEAVHAKIGALARAAIVLVRLGGAGLVGDIIEEVAALAGGLDRLEPVSASRVHAVRALLARAVGDVPGCFAACELADAANREAQDVRTDVYQGVTWAGTYFELGRPELGLPIIERAVAVAERLQLHSVLALTYLLSAYGHAFAGGHEAALRFAEQASAAAHDDLAINGLAKTVVADVLERMGRAAEAEAAATEAIAIAPPLGLGAPLALAARARARAALGRVAEAVLDAKQADGMVERPEGFAVGETSVSRTLVQVLEAAGEADAARAALAAAKRRLLARAERLGEWRESFLLGVPDNRSILQLAEEKGV